MNVWRLVVHHEEQEQQHALKWISEQGRIALGWGRISDIRKIEPTSYHGVSD